MLTRSYDVQPIGEMLPQPTASHSALLAAQKPFYEVAGFGADVLPSLSSEGTRKRIADKLDVINSTLSDPRISNTQGALNKVSEWGASIAATAPLAYLGVEAVGGAAALAGFGGSLALPEAVLSFARTPIPKLIGTEFAEKLPQATPAELAKGIAQLWGAYKGMVLPEHVVANYHKENDTLDWRHAIKDWASDNYGFMLPIVPFAGGYLLFKVLSVNRGAKEAGDLARKMIAEHQAVSKARSSNLQFAMGRAQKAAAEAALETKKATRLEGEFNAALENRTITKAEHAWYMDYLKNPDDHANLSKGAFPILQGAQIPFDRATGRVWFEMFDRENVKNLKQSISDEVSSGFSKEQQSAISSFIVHNRMDAMRSVLAENPNMVHGLRGMSAYIDKKLEGKAKAVEALDEIVTKHLPKGLKKNEIFSQDRIFKHLKKKGIYESEQVPYSVPERVKYKLKLQRKLDNILQGKSDRYRKWFSEADRQKLKDEIESIRLPTPHEELEEIKAKLITEKGIKKNFRNNAYYHRLQELADVWANAKHLLDRIHFEHEYERQAAFNGIIKNFVSLVDSNASRLADPNRVVEYMKGRIETSVPYAREFRETTSPLPREVAKGTEKVGETEVKATPKENAQIKANREMVKRFGSEGLKAEYKIEENRFNQFAENENALKELVECAFRGVNG